MPGLTHWASPGFMAFFACSGSHPAALAEMYSNAFNGAHFNWICSPAVTELETVVMDWLAQAIALPGCFLSEGSTAGGGVIQGSASEAVLTVMVAARDRYLAAVTADMPEGEEKEEEIWRRRSRLVALGSSSAHSSTLKAANILGVRYVGVPVTEESNWAMTGDGLAKVLADLDAKGLEPFYLTATLGSTDVCAVDDFAGIARALELPHSSTLKQGEKNPAPSPGKHSNVWVHVDAAWAGAALLLEENQSLTPPFAHFHSFNFNPHKWMLTTFDCSALWVRQRRDLVTSALSVQPAYLRNEHDIGGGLVTDYRDWQIPLGRRFRSLKLWFVMRSYGVRGLQDHIRSRVTLGESLEAKLRARGDLFTIFTGARFALVTFRVVGSDEAQVKQRTEKLYATVNAGGEFFLTSTVVGGKFVIRICTGVERMKEEHVQKVFDRLEQLTEELVKGIEE